MMLIPSGRLEVLLFCMMSSFRVSVSSILFAKRDVSFPAIHKDGHAFRVYALLLFEVYTLYVYTRHALRFLLDGVSHSFNRFRFANFLCTCGYASNAFCCHLFCCLARLL